jgi:glyoxalase family protein
MQLEGIHHVTAITGDAPSNVDFYARVLGLRMVKRTVNQDDPTVWHLFYADDQGSPGADITFFEYPGAPRGTAGAGMVHRVAFRVGSEAALDFWERRLQGEGVTAVREGRALRFADPEGLELELRAADVSDPPLVARQPDIPLEHALQGFDGVHAYSADSERSRQLLEQTLGFRPVGERAWEARGQERGSLYVYDPPPGQGRLGAGTVHHVAWACRLGEETEWQRRIARAGLQPTPVIDRFYFRSVYFREPSGVLFEIATMGPGFTADEPFETLGERVSLPPAFEHLREQIERTLTPLPPPRERAKA